MMTAKAIGHDTVSARCCVNVERNTGEGRLIYVCLRQRRRIGGGRSGGRVTQRRRGAGAMTVAPGG